MSPPPLISVVMPVFNARRFLCRAIRSIQAQRVTDWRMIVVNDGSTDGSGDALDGIARHDVRIAVIHQSNQGLVPALNAGVRAARSEFIGRMDADDIAWPDRFEKQLAYLERHPDCVAVGGWARMVDPGGWPIGVRRLPADHEAIDAALMAGGGYIIPHPGVTMRREAVERVGGYRPDLRYGEDLDLYLRLAEVGKLANLSQVVVDYRLHLKNTSKTKAAEQAACSRRAVADACERRGLPSPELKQKSAEGEAQTLPQLRESWWWFARHHGYHGSALRQTVGLLGHRPWSVKLWKRGLGDVRRLLCDGAQPTVSSESETVIAKAAET